jgi:hypothetical protein
MVMQALKKELHHITPLLPLINRPYPVPEVIADDSGEDYHHGTH